MLTVATVLVSLVCALLHSAASAQPANDDSVRAKQLFVAGVADYDAGRYAEALAQFQAAYRTKPHPLVKVNIANCFLKLDRPVEAIENFEAFLGMTDGTPTQRDEVRAALKELREKVGHVVFKVTPAGARIVIDDRDERHSPLPDPVLASVGRHRVTISLEGYETSLRVVDVKAHETSQLEVELARLPEAEQIPPSLEAPAPAFEATDEDNSSDEPTTTLTPAPAPLPAVRADASPPRRRALPISVWLAGGATFALVVSAVVTGQLALAADREFDGDLAAIRNPQLTEFQRAGAWARGVDAADRADALAASTDVLLGLALVGAGLTTYFYLADRADNRSPSARVSASAGPGTGVLRYQGHF